jgi:hypothetical protein
MWQSESKFLNSNQIWKISIFCGEEQITYSEVIKLWQQDDDFRDFFISLLANTPWSAYFWETPPVSEITVNQTFKFVLVNSLQLASVRGDFNNFRRYFESSTEAILTFPNLRQDALLIVPRPLNNKSAYPHLASFVREAPKSQQHLLWQTVGRELEQKLNQQPIWVSTSGLGVYWLHIRLDSYPKYYRFKPYKQIC